MPAQMIEPTDYVEVKNLPLLLYGPPGCGKTSIAQTSLRPLTLDFDKGIHRSFNRKRAMRFDTWGDCLAEQQKGTFAPYATLVLDTLGALLDAMAREIMQEGAKNAMGGGLSIQGWGVLGNRFGQWIRQLVAQGQDVVMVCHEEEEKDVAGNRYLRPAMPGKMAYTVVHRMVDLMGRVQFDGRARSLQFSPTELAVGKNAAGWDVLPVPQLENAPQFLAGLFEDAKGRIGRTAEASAAVARAVKDWTDALAQNPDLARLNKDLLSLSDLPATAKQQAWHLVQQYAESQKWTFDKASKAFVVKGAA